MDPALADIEDGEVLVRDLAACSYLYPGLAVVHATDATSTQPQALERAGASLALTPLSEQRVGYGLPRLDHFGAVHRKGLGLDGNALAGSADMFATLRLAALTWSGATRDERAPDPRALLDMATRGDAEALGLSKETGTLTPGKRDGILEGVDLPRLQQEAAASARALLGRVTP